MNATKTVAKAEEKAIVKMSPERLAEIRELTGEGNKPYANMNIPQLSIDGVEEFLPKKKGGEPTPNPDYAKFRITTRERSDDGQWEKKVEYLEEKINVVILRARFYAGKWNKNLGKNGLPEFYTLDFDDWGDIVVMENFETKDRKIYKREVARGAYDALKKKYTLKPNLILYVLYGGKVMRLKGSPTTLGPWFDYKKMFDGSSIAVVETELSSEKTKSEEGMPWYRLLQFRQNGVADDAEVFPILKEFNLNLKAFEAYQGTVDHDTDTEGVTDTDIDEIFVDSKPTVETKAIPETTAEDMRKIPTTAKAVGSEQFDL